MTAKREYIYEIHYIRAIASLMVLLVHVSASFYYEQGQQYNDYTFFINQISRFGTPMFAMISGFLLFYQTRKRGFNLKKFFSSRFTKIGVPFIFWSVFYLFFMYFVLDINPMKDGLDVFLVNFFAGNSFYHLYFISIVFQFYLIFPVLQVFRSKLSWAFLLVIASFINWYFLKLFLPGQFEGILKTILSQRAFLPQWIFFFIFGGYLAYHWESLLAFSKKYKIALSVAAVIITVLAVIEYKNVGSIPSNRLTNFINIPILTFFIMGITDVIRKISWLSLFLEKIGTLSMAIYLVHPFVINIFQRIAPEIVWKTSLFPVTFGILLIGTIGTINIIQLLPFGKFILTIPKIKESNNQAPVTKQSPKVPLAPIAKRSI